MNHSPLSDLLKEDPKGLTSDPAFLTAAALLESEARFREMIDALPAAIYTTDAEGRLTHFNPAAVEFAGRVPELGTDQWCVTLKLYHPDGTPMPHDECPMAIALKENCAVRGAEAIAERPDGTRVWFMLYPTPLRDAEGNIVGGINMLVDITERKRAEEAKFRLSLQQTLVLGKLTIGQGKRAAATLPVCLDVMKKMDDILSEALTYTRTLVADLSPPVLRDHGLPAGLKWLGEYMKKHQIAVTVAIPEKDDLKLPEDQAVLLFQSVRELLINSSKHAGTRKADVRLERYDGRLRIKVSDQGVGFDLAAAAAGTPSGGISSKFGLFSIRERMRALGGTLEVQSAPGQGTTATPTLPLARSAELSGKNSALKSQDSALHEKPRIRVLLWTTIR